MKKALGFVLLAWSCLTLGTVVEVDKMDKILPEITPETLVIFDLDNTLIRPSQTLGSDQWFESLVESQKKALDAEGFPETTSLSKAVDIAIEKWVKVQLVTEVLPIESGTSELVRQIQSRGNRVLGLTARPADLQEATERQLKSVGIDLAKNAVSTDKLTVSVDELPPGKFVNGIFFIGPKNNKGQMLVKLLEAVDLEPKKVVFADDKKKHVDNVGEWLKNSPVTYLGFRYSAADPLVKAFRKEIADAQWKVFEKPMSDADAEKLVGRTTVKPAPKKSSPRKGNEKIS